MNMTQDFAETVALGALGWLDMPMRARAALPGGAEMNWT